jgi:hypothetical protein
MAAKGRGPDTQLIHMSDREVAGLQALAKAHGGSLTINPEIQKRQKITNLKERLYSQKERFEIEIKKL